MNHWNWGSIPQEQLNERLSRKFVSGEKITLAQLFLHQGCLVPEHSHESEQLSLVMTGCLKFNVENHVQIVKTNELLRIPCNAKHSVEVLEDSLVYDIFSPVRQDWLDGSDAYLRK